MPFGPGGMAIAAASLRVSAPVPRSTSIACTAPSLLATKSREPASAMP
ncbi:MAG: hypothetical protein QM820_48695 [Minicystis sp.]